MSTEFNYVARLDTSQIMSGLSEIRSQVGMVLGGQGGFGGGPLSATNFGGGAASGINQMVGSFAGGFGTPGQGGTFTDAAMSYSPHYGMQGASTTLEQEGLIMKGGRGQTGMEWAGRFAPPGVSAGEFAFAAMGNSIDRQIQSREAASLAGQAALFSSAGGLMAGNAAMALATPLGAMAGGAAATSMFGAGAAGAGRAVGGLAAGVAAMFGVSDYVGGKIQDHYANVEQTMGVTRELGDIVGSGRGLNRSQQGEMGIAARKAAGDIRMDVNQFGDVMALAREAGMMPSSTDPQKARQQMAEYASAIREGAETLHSSLATATQVIKNATQKGLTIEEGMIRAQNVGQSGLGPMMYSMGEGVGRGMGFTGAQGGQLFAGALGQAAGSGISGEEMKILGSQTGVAALIGGTQLQAAASPLGNLQMMAARGGQPLGGLMDLPGQALDAMSQGGDMLSNMGKFMVHGDEYRRGIGSKGVRTMAMQQLESMGDVLSELMPGMSANEAKRMAAMQMYGMTGTQAEAYVGGMGRPMGDGSDGLTRAKQMAQMSIEGQEGRLGSALSKLPKPEERASFGWGWASEGAMIGSVGGIKGAIVGGAVGLVAGNLKAAWQAGGDMMEDLGHVFDSSTEKADRAVRKANETYDRSEAGVKDKLGYMKADVETTARAMTADLSGTTLTMTSPSGRGMAMTEAAMRLSGMTPVSAGPGTMQMGGVSYSLKDMQRVSMGIGGRALNLKEREQVEQSAYQAFFDPGANKRFKAAYQGESMDVVTKRISGDMKTIAEGDPLSEDYRSSMNRISGDVMSLTNSITDKKAREALQADIKKRGFVGEGTMGRAFLEAGRMPVGLLKNPALQTQLGLGTAAGDTLREQERLEEEHLIKAYGPVHGGDLADQHTVAKAWRNNPRYERAKQMIKSGADPDKINAEFKAAYASAIVGIGGVADKTQIVGGVGAPKDAGTGAMDIDKFDYRKQLRVSDKDREAKVAAIEAGARSMDTLEKIGGMSVSGRGEAWKKEQLKNLGEESKEMQSLGTGALGEKSKTDQLRPKYRGPQVHERAIGFGEQEQAMTAINRSLQRTHSMITALDKKISSGSGSPPTPTGETRTSTYDGPPKTGGGWKRSS